jgi:predicted Zn-ribbon and HTH transcriptional regulator
MDDKELDKALKAGRDFFEDAFKADLEGEHRCWDCGFPVVASVRESPKCPKCGGNTRLKLVPPSEYARKLNREL